jgi:hypothetical protein
MTTTSYETCSMEFSDTSTQLAELLACISTAEQASRVDIATGLDAFFLIYAGALVLYVYIHTYIYTKYSLLLLLHFSLSFVVTFRYLIFP